MSLPPADLPFADEEEDRKRKAEIEDMMRWQRDSYFRNEPMQQEYRDVVDRLANRQAEAAYRVAQTDDPARSTYPRVDANDISWLFDGGEAEARSIFRRDGEIVPDKAPNAFPDLGVGKGDRLPVSRPELPQSPSAGRADAAAGPPVRRQDDPARAFEVDTPLRLDGESRVEQLQRRAQIRKLPITQGLEDQINYAAQKNGVGVEVHSGGQVPEAKSSYKQTGVKDRTGSDRHDDGHAADVDLYVIESGKRRYLDSKNPTDQKIIESFIRDVVAAGVTGVGHGYMPVYANGAITKTRRIHVGAGEEKSWGNGAVGNRGIPWVEAARQQGVAARDTLLKAGSWPSPTASLKFATPQHAASDLPAAVTGDTKTLSTMRDMIEKYMLRRGFK